MASGRAAEASPPQHLPCASPGNPVFSCTLQPGAPPPPYRTTSGDYGAVPPTAQTAPCRHFPRDNAFTDHLFACGKTPGNGINTALDRSRVCGHPHLLHLL